MDQKRIDWAFRSHLWFIYVTVQLLMSPLGGFLLKKTTKNDKLSQFSVKTKKSLQHLWVNIHLFTAGLSSIMLSLIKKSGWDNTWSKMYAYWLIDWLTDWLIDWLIEWINRISWFIYLIILSTFVLGWWTLLIYPLFFPSETHLALFWLFHHDFCIVGCN